MDNSEEVVLVWYISNKGPCHSGMFRHMVAKHTKSVQDAYINSGGARDTLSSALYHTNRKSPTRLRNTNGSTVPQSYINYVSVNTVTIGRKLYTVHMKVDKSHDSTDVFVKNIHEQEEYNYEDIAIGDVAFSDNSEVLKLIEDCMELIAILNKDCVCPKGNYTLFVSKLKSVNSEISALVNERLHHPTEFDIDHYICLVKVKVDAAVPKAILHGKAKKTLLTVGTKF
eukprot:4260148-Ditylum_brightwellii.AAC.1